MITIPPCILVAHDPLPRMRAAYGQELGSHCDLLFLPHLAPADRAEARARARVLIAQNPRVEITAGDVAAMTSLGFVQLLSAGVDHVPLHLFPRDVPIASNAGAFAGPMAEFVLAMTLAAAKRLPVEHQEMSSPIRCSVASAGIGGCWSGSSPPSDEACAAATRAGSRSAITGLPGFSTSSTCFERLGASSTESGRRRPWGARDERQWRRVSALDDGPGPECRERFEGSVKTTLQ